MSVMMQVVMKRLHIPDTIQSFSEMFVRTTDSAEVLTNISEKL